MLRKLKENPIREKNRAAALEYIINKGKVSRAEIANHIQINKASVSEIVKNLIDYEIIEEIGIGSSSQLGGRKPVLLQLKKDAGVFLSIDLGYNYIKMLLTYLNGDILLHKEYNDIEIDRESIRPVLKEVISEILKDLPITKYGLSAITLGIHGAVLEDRIEFTPYYDLVHLPIKEYLQDVFHTAVYYENEANLSAIANHAIKQEHHDLISISIHSGVGAGIIVNDTLYKGETGFSGEIGHMILYPHGKPCPCGNFGCLEKYCSQKAVEEYFRDEFHKKLSLSDIRLLYDEGDMFTVSKIKEISSYLAIGVNNLSVAFDPQIIYFNCALVCMFPEIITEIKKNLTSFLSKKRTIEISPIADCSILIGGILVAMKRSLLIEHMQLQNLGLHRLID